MLRSCAVFNMESENGKGGIGGDCLKLVDSAGIVEVKGWYVKTGALRE